MGLQYPRCFDKKSLPISTRGHKCVLKITILMLLCALVASTPVNVALNKPVTALYTCGIFGKETFNTLSDAYRPASELPRRTCADLRPFNVSTRQSPVIKPTFPPEAMVDGANSTSWQSVSRSRAYTYGQEIILEVSKGLEAVININLMQEFLVESIMIYLGDALTPQKVSIEKSLDGTIFTPWIYAVSSQELCSQFFNVTTKSAPASLMDTVCVTYIADDKPPGDVIVVNLSQVAMTLKEWQRVRSVKIKFFDMQFVSPYSTLAHNFNHYSVQEITVMAECPCNGLQVGCEINPTSGMYECICGGNATGKYCESCLPLFNQFPFQFGRPCVACNCFEHATSCFYEASVENAGLSLDKNGNKSGGGVCTDCQHNTEGINCEKCVNLYYRPANQSQTAVNACIPCNCNHLGSTVNPATGLVDCIMNNDKPLNDGKVPGDCFCKTNVMGSKCASCKAGFYNLQLTNPDGCTPCACNAAGTVNGSTLCNQDFSGQCRCKINVQRRDCDQCKDGFYGLTNGNINGCTACDCDIGGALNQICDKDTGQCVCRSENIQGRRCDTVHPDFFYPGLHGISSELEDSYGQVTWKRDPLYTGFSGRGYAVLRAGSSLSVLLTIPANSNLSGNYSLIVRYHGSVEVNLTIQILSGDNALLSVPLLVCPTTWCEVNTSVVDPVQLQSVPNLLNLTVGSGEALLDKIVAVPVDFLHPESVLPYSLPVGCDLMKNTQPSNPTDAAACQRVIFSLSMFYFGAPLPCNCDFMGSVSATCNISGGQCQCQPGVTGRTCNKCLPNHYSFTSTGCTPCNCDEFGTICDSVTGQCQCPDNTMGQHCEHCVPTFWAWNKTAGCKPCECDLAGSISQQCNVTTGFCICKSGVQGAKCDQCMDGFFNLSSQGCSSCLCSEAGSVESVCNKTTGQCTCKKNTDGRQCDVCKLGTFGLDSKNPEGCLDCVCMGITKNCTSAGIKLISNLYQMSVKTNTGIAPSLNLIMENGSIANMSVRFDANTDMTTASVVDLTAADPRLYWQMPDVLVTSLLSLYGTNILFTVNYIIVDNQSSPTDHKAVLIDKNGSILEYPLFNVTQGNDSLLVITLKENGWKVATNGSVVTRGMFLKSLSSAKLLMLPASFSKGKHTSRLSRLEFSSVSDVGLVNPAVEQCACGVEYTGTSCQFCAPGYTRENNGSADYFGECVTCMCHSHSATCDMSSGICQNCLNNTTGVRCEKCLPGYYGNATIGTDSDCTACPCNLPRVVNATCEKSANSTDIVCLFCQDGYVGIHCDECARLYYGSPKSVNGTCLPCECNGNAASCDNITGICNSCLFNTTGNNCQRCITGFYGNASHQNCQECQCLQETSNATVCDFITGQCPCVFGVGGRTCDQCLMGYWGYSVQDFIGCKACGCVEAGSLSVQCNNNTGQCSCKPNTSGTFCDSCVDGFFGLPLLSCQACQCDPVGSINTTKCNMTNGQCECRPGIGGRRCDQCLPFFVNYSSSGCQECGLCQKTLGDNVNNQSWIATELLNLTLIVVGVQMEDVRLQNLSSRLNQSLDSLGLAGSNTTSVNDTVQNVSNMSTVLVTNFDKTKNKIASLMFATQYTTSNGSTEVTRQLEIAQKAENLSREVTYFHTSFNDYVWYLTSSNKTASQYLNRTAGSSNSSFTFEAERNAATLLLSLAQNSSYLNATNAVIYQQSSDIASMNTTMITIGSDMDAVIMIVANITSALDTQYYLATTVGNMLAEATVFQSQAEDLRNAVLVIINSTESKNVQSLVYLSAARAAARNTNVVISGDAVSVMAWTNATFASGVSNFDSGISKMNNLQALVPLLIDRVTPTVNDSESHVSYLEIAFANFSSEYQNISPVAKDAVEAINNYKTILTDLDTAVSTIATANQLIAGVQGNVTGDGFSRLQQEYTAEKATADTLRQQLMELDYGPQVVQNNIDTETDRLNTEASQWAQVDVEMNAVRVAAQTLNSLVTGNVKGIRI